MGDHELVLSNYKVRVALNKSVDRVRSSNTLFQFFLLLHKYKSRKLQEQLNHGFWLTILDIVYLSFHVRLLANPLYRGLTTKQMMKWIEKNDPDTLSKLNRVGSLKIPMWSQSSADNEEGETDRFDEYGFTGAIHLCSFSKCRTRQSSVWGYSERPSLSCSRERTTFLFYDATGTLTLKNNIHARAVQSSFGWEQKRKWIGRKYPNRFSKPWTN